MTFLIIAFVIVRHLLNQNETETKKSLDEIVEEKRRQMEHSRIIENPIKPFLEDTNAIDREDPEFFEEIERKLQWGGEDFNKQFNQELKSQGYDVVLNNSNQYMKVLTLTSKSKADFLHSLLVSHVEDLLINKNTMSVGPMNLHEIKFNLMILLDESEKLFKYFNGTKESVLKFKLEEGEYGQISHLINPEFFARLKALFQETQSFFLLPEGKVTEFFQSSKDSKKIFRELSLHYHPDKIPWRYVPDQEKKRLEKVYSDFYAFIQKIYSANV